jgi:hypothetical protein
MAFSRKVRTQAINSIGTFAQHAIKFHASPALTAEDIYKALVKPEHVEHLAQTDKLVGVVQRHSRVSIPADVPNSMDKVSLHMAFVGGSLDKLLPEYTRNGFHTRSVLTEQIAAWVDRRYYIGAGFANVREVFLHLDDYLSTPAQVKFYFDGVTSILDRHEDTQAMANKLREPKFPGKLPALPREVRDAAIEATKFLAQMALLPSGEPDTTPFGVHLFVEDFGFQKLSWKQDLVRIP